jgi:hypothetical protein
MSEPTQEQAEANLENRLVQSHIGTDYTLANYKGEFVVFIRGKWGEEEADVVMSADNVIAMAEEIQETIKNAEQPEKLDSVEPTE